MNPAASLQPISSLVGGEVIAVGPTATLAHVARVMTDADIGAVAVGSPDNVVGVVSERDLTKAVSRGDDTSTVTAGDVCSRELVWCQEDSVVGEVATEMFEKYVRHVLVASADGLAGIVSARDLLGAYAAEDLSID